MKSIKNLFSRKTDTLHSLKSPEFHGTVSAERILEIFSDCGDLKTEQILAGADRTLPVTVIFFDELTDASSAAREIIEPLTSEKFSGISPEKAFFLAKSGGIIHPSFNVADTLDDAVKYISSGLFCIIFGDFPAAICFDARSHEKRSVSAPNEEKAVKGAKEAFVENLNTNLGLIRRKISSPELKVVSETVGRRTRTKISLIYISGLADPEKTSEALCRLKAIDTDSAIFPAVLEEYLSDAPRCPFPQFITTERADKFCMNLLEGRFGILADGLPVGYIAPATFAQLMKAPEDNSEHFLIASVLTLLRYISLLITLLLPAFYIAVATFHREMLPTRLMLSIIASKDLVPFSTPVEVLGMLVAFELLQEAGLRLPGPVGQTVSIIGALIVGQSAVEARVISPVVVIVVAIAGVTGYTLPNQDLASAVRLCRFLLALAAVVGGMYGLAAGAALIVYGLCSVESFGVPYMTPFSSANLKNILRAVLRLPLKYTKFREKPLNTPDKRSRK